MKLFLIRHGQTDWSINGKIQGSCDIELNATGIKQAEDLSNRILEEKYNFSKIYSSSKIRAAKTAEILSKVTNVEYVLIDGIEEINFGEWEGLSWKEIEEKYPIEYEEWLVNRRYTKPPKGESYQDMLQRVLHTINQIMNENSENVVIVTHSAVIMCIQCYLTNTPFEDMRKFKVDNASVIEIDGEFLIKKEDNMDKDNKEVNQDNLEEQKISEEEETNEEEAEGNYMSLGMCIGMCLGLSFGRLFFDNMALGLSLGMCLGMVIGSSIKKRN